MQVHDESLVRQACTYLISHYAYLNDERRFEELAALFAEDALLYRPSAPDQAIEGRQAILEAFRKRPPDTMTFHVCTDILIDVQGEQVAVGRSRILLLSATRPPHGTSASVQANMPVPGVFRDIFRLTEEGWKFAERRGMFWI